MKKEDIINVLQSLKSEVQKKYKGEIKGLFGSFARNEEKNESDIDILVSFSEDASLLDLTGMGDFLETRFERKVDIVSKRALRKEIEEYIYKDLISI